MSEEIIELMVEGGKATATPAMAQQIGPLGINVGEIVGNINEKTKDFKGMKVPVTVTVDTDSKEVNLSVGTPPTAELIKKELGTDKGSGVPDKKKVGNLGIEQIIKITKMKMDDLIVSDLRAGIKSVMGTCNSLGVLVEGKVSNEVSLDEFKKEIDSESTDISSDKASKLKKQLKEVQAELDAKFAKLEQEAEEAAAEEAAADEADKEEEEEEAAPAEGEEGKTPEGEEGEEKPEGEEGAKEEGAEPEKKPEEAKE